MPGRPKVTAANTPAKKARMLELIAEGRDFTESCAIAEVSRRTFDNWRQRDEKFAVAVERAYRDGTSTLVRKVQGSLDDPKVPEREKTLRYFFLIKQRDPSFRDNHKVEHVVSGGLQSALKKLAKLGAE